MWIVNVVYVLFFNWLLDFCEAIIAKDNVHLDITYNSYKKSGARVCKGLILPSSGTNTTLQVKKIFFTTVQSVKTP